MSFLNISHLEKSFGANRVVKDFSLAVEKGELGMAALKAMAGHFDPDGRLNPGVLLPQ